jgi:hypothetical protein
MKRTATLSREAKHTTTINTIKVCHHTTSVRSNERALFFFLTHLRIVAVLFHHHRRRRCRFPLSYRLQTRPLLFFRFFFFDIPSPLPLNDVAFLLFACARQANEQENRQNERKTDLLVFFDVDFYLD